MRLGFWLGLLCLVLPSGATGEVVRGIYGVPSIGDKDPLTYVGEMERAGVNAVFVKPDPDTVKWFRERGFKVFVSVDAYGGKGAWKRFPDSTPVLADGSMLSERSEYGCHGGACPTHEAWRTERLAYIDGLIREYEAARVPLDGIWLDYIRYPGRWSLVDPKIPDACYCERCLGKFSKDTGIELPKGKRTQDVSLWIQGNAPYEWMRWKKAQIELFVRDVRRLVDQHAEKTRSILGIFLVPWTQGERRNAVYYAFGQDPFELARYADVISPMAYHKKVGQQALWVGFMTQYYEETVPCQVWPIVQAMDCSPEEFAGVMRYAGEGGADGVLGFTFGAVEKAGLWEGFQAFQPLVNLIPDPEFERIDGIDDEGVRGSEDEGMRGLEEKKVWERGDGLDGWMVGGKKDEWMIRKNGRGDDGDGDLLRSRFRVSTTDRFSDKEGHSLSGPVRRCIGITEGIDRAGVWWSLLPKCTPGAEYVFTGRFYQENWQNGVYPSVSIWGDKHHLDTLWIPQIFQPVRVYTTCPENVVDDAFRFINPTVGKTFWLTEPRLTRNYSFWAAGGFSSPCSDFFDEDFFPIGVYGAKLEELKSIEGLGMNTVLLSGKGDALKKLVQTCHQIGLKYVISARLDPDRLPVFLEEISAYVRPQDMAFYVNDEPGIHSFPIGKAMDMNRLIKERFPGSATCMAVVRPQACRDYTEAADFFMLDQYPIPYMPMIWLSDCMEECAEGIRGRRAEVGGQGSGGMEAQSSKLKAEGGITNDESSNHPMIQSSNKPAKRLASVIQAFGGPTRPDHPRLPTWQEMDCLAFLSVVHGSRGIFFFTYSWIGKTEEGQGRLGQVVRRLNRVYPWLVQKNLRRDIEVEVLSRYAVGPDGEPAVHACIKESQDGMLIIAVNTLGTFVEARLSCAEMAGVAGAENYAQEVFSGGWHAVVDGAIQTEFGPYETRAFLCK